MKKKSLSQYDVYMWDNIIYSSNILTKQIIR